MGLKKISEYKKKMNLTTEELSDKSGVPIGTLNKILSGATKDPKIETLKAISKVLGLSLDAFDDEELLKSNDNATNNNISSTEYKHILKYRSLDDTGKNRIDYELDREIERVEEWKKQSEYIKHLETAEHNDNKISDVDKRLINYYYRVASAGTGQIIFDMPPTKRIEIPNTPDYRKVDYAIGVNGTSMQPLYNDGDMLLVEMTEDIEIGEIGIFRINGESFVKKLGETELISLNPASKNIPLNESAEYMGKVIGKLP